MKNYMTPCVTLIQFKEDVVTASNNNFIEDNFDDLPVWEGHK